MNVLFLTLAGFESIKEHNLYTDLLREFVKNGHSVYAISPIEKRQNQETHLIKEDNAVILRLKIGNTQKTNIIEKGISTIMIEPAIKKAIDRYFSDIKFDLVLYSTPPITFVSAIEYVKKRDGAKTYLLLKDIFPQNAVDIGLMTTTGIKGFIYRYFRKQEKKLYAISDQIGCMSQANVDYVIKHNPEIDASIVEICPNSIDIVDKSVDKETRDAIRAKYEIPLDKKVFVYGGNLGKPQGIPFLIECLQKCENIIGVYFLIVGSGTEYSVLENYMNSRKPQNAKLMKQLSKEDYDTMIGACDVGMIFLDNRFTIPNFPSRLLDYMAARLPVLAATDTNSDIGKVITENGFGWWCESSNSMVFCCIVTLIAKSGELGKMGSIGYDFLKNNYYVDSCYKKIINK